MRQSLLSNISDHKQSSTCAMESTCVFLHQNILNFHSFARAWNPVSFIIIFLSFVFSVRISLFLFHFSRIGNKTIISFKLWTEIAARLKKTLHLFVDSLSPNSDAYSELISQQEATTHVFRIENRHGFIVFDLDIRRADKLIFSTFPSLKLDIYSVARKRFNHYQN